MYIKIYDKDKISKRFIQKKEFKSKAVIINSSDEILLTYMNNSYLFPGGRSNEGESKSETLVREVKEETGIILPDIEYNPFYQIQKFKITDKKRKINTYHEYNYFLINTDDKYDLSKRNLDEYEKKANLELLYVKLSDLEELLNRTINYRQINNEIYSEISTVMNNYYEQIRKVDTRLVLKY